MNPRALHTGRHPTWHRHPLQVPKRRGKENDMITTFTKPSMMTDFIVSYEEIDVYQMLLTT